MTLFQKGMSTPLSCEMEDFIETPIRELRVILILLL